jgi:hypothetical protein
MTMNLLFKHTIGILLLVFLFSSGCIPAKRVAPEKKQLPVPVEQKKIKSIKQTYFIHVVKWDGESLSLISRWYIGTYEDWKLLSKHNPELNPLNIHVGDRVWIPKDKMIITTQMPKAFLNQYQKKITKPVILKPKTTEKKPIELYGPKEHKEKAEEYRHD